MISCILRLGISTRQSTVVYKISEDEDVSSPLMREAIRLAEDSRLLYNVPVTVPLFFQVDETEKKKVEKKQQDQAGGKRGNPGIQRDHHPTLDWNHRKIG